MIPSLVRQVTELLENSDDEAIALLRYFGWNFPKLEDKWFSMSDDEKLKVGLTYNEKLIEKYPDINATRKENNDNMCPVMYMELEEGDPDYDYD